MATMQGPLLLLVGVVLAYFINCEDEDITASRTRLHSVLRARSNPDVRPEDVTTVNMNRI